MGKREDYEHLEIDLDEQYYYFMNSDVQLPYKEPKLKEFVEYWRKNEVNNGLYYKGTKIYFTFQGVKYWESWTFYDKDFLKGAITLLKKLGAVNIQLNYGELD